jgi:hypothetical protein
LFVVTSPENAGLVENTCSGSDRRSDTLLGF